MEKCRIRSVRMGRSIGKEVISSAEATSGLDLLRQRTDIICVGVVLNRNGKAAPGID